MNKNNYELINKAKLELIDIDNTLDSFTNKDSQISLIELDLLKDKVKDLYENIDKMEIFSRENFIKQPKMPDFPILNNENENKEDNKNEIVENNEDNLLKNNDFSVEDKTLIFTKEEKNIEEEVKKEEIIEQNEIDTSTPSDIEIDFFGQEEPEETIEEKKVIINENIIEEDIALDIKEEVVKQEEETIEEEVIEEIIEEQQPKQEYIEGKTVKPEDKKKNNILADKFTQNSHTLINEIQNDNNSLGEQMRDNAISDINSAISMNDRFWLQKELFSGKQEDLFIAINKLNSCTDITEALNSFNKISKKHKWDEENKAVIKLKKLVERRYL